MIKATRVVVTGPTGAIGMALIEYLTKRDIKVVAIVHPDSKRKNRLNKFSNITVIEKDICNYASLDISGELVRQNVCKSKEEASYDIWIHFAWNGASGKGRNDVEMQLRNVEGVMTALEIAKKAGCHTFLGAGSQAEYGLSNQPIGEQSITQPFTGYGMAKLCAGQMGALKAEQLGIRFVWTRICSVYGPYDGENTMLISGIRSLLKNDCPKFTKGEQQWDFLYAPDAAKIIWQLALNGKHNRKYTLGSGKTRCISEYIEIMKQTVENLTEQKHEVSFGEIPYAQNQVMYLCADLRAIKEDVGEFSFVEFEQGIYETIKWCMDNVAG